MRRREVAAVIVVVVLLLAVIGQRRAARLAPADAAAVGERRQEQRVDAAELGERSRTLSVPSSRKETAPTWMPIGLAGICADGVGGPSGRCRRRRQRRQTFRENPVDDIALL